MTASRFPAAISSASTCDLAADDQGVVVGDDRAQLLARQARSLVDLVMGAEEVNALLRDRLGDEDPHAPVPAAAGVISPNDSIAATWAAATAEPGRTDRPNAIDANSSDADRAEDLLERDRAEVAEPEDLAGQLALPAGEHDTAPLDLGVERLPVEVVGHDGGGDRARRDARIGEQLEAERGQAGAGRRGTRRVPGEDVLGALGGHQPDALVDLVDDRDRRRPRRLAVGVRVAVGPQVEVDPRQRSRSPSPSRRVARPRSWPARAPTSRPSASRSRRRPRPRRPSRTARRPRPDTLSTRIRASGAASRTTAASSAIGFITPVEVSLWVSSTAW